MADKDRLIYKIIKNRDKILEIAKKHGVENIRVFGSVSRKQEKRDSDIDLLVDVVKKPDGTRGNYIAFAMDVKKIYKRRRLDVCTSENLHPKFKEKVLTKCISIMEDDPQIDRDEKDERDLTVNIDKALDFIKEYKEGISIEKDAWINDKIMRSFSMKSAQNAIEEIVRAIPKQLKLKIKDVDWNGLKEFRNFIVHHYEDVEWEAMWEFAQGQIKETEKACERILEVLGEEEKESKKVKGKKK